MKKLFALLLVFVLVVGALAGCSPAPAEETPEEPTTETPAEPATEEPTGPVEITAKELMKSVNARKAMALAIDKSYVTDVILANGSIPADYFVPVGLASDENGDDFRSAYPDGWLHHDVDMAKDYWAKAKEELGFDVVAIEFLTYDSETSKKISEFIQGQLQDTLEGLSVTLNQQPFKNKLDLAAKGEYEIQFAGWGPDYPDPMTFMDMWVTGGGHNDAGYSNPVFDENIQRTKSGDLTSDPAGRWALLQETEELLINQDAVLVPMYQRAGAVLRQPYVTGIHKHAFGGDYTYKYADTTLMTDGKKVIRVLDGSDIPSMDTNKATDSVSFEMMSNVLEGLFSLGENDVVEYGVAESYEVSEDGLTYTFKLREDAVWSNGDPVTAHDFVYSWRRLVDPATGSQYAFMGETAALQNAAAIMNAEAEVDTLGVEATDDYTLVAKLDVPVPFFTKLLTFPNFYPVNQAFVESLDADTFGTTIETTLYNGPFKLNSWELGYQFGFEKNDMYWNADVVNIDAVTYRIVKDAAAGINLYETGEVDRAGLSGEFVEQYIDDPNYYEITDTVLFYLVFNINNTGQNAH